MRLDVYLVEQGFFKTRTKASLAIKSQAILVNGKMIDKPNYEVSSEVEVKVLKEVNPYVSRGGWKRQFKNFI